MLGSILLWLLCLIIWWPRCRHTERSSTFRAAGLIGSCEFDWLPMPAMQASLSTMRSQRAAVVTHSADVWRWWRATRGLRRFARTARYSVTSVSRRGLKTPAPARLEATSSASLIMLSINSLTVGMSWMRPTT